MSRDEHKTVFPFAEACGHNERALAANIDWVNLHIQSSGVTIDSASLSLSAGYQF